MKIYNDADADLDLLKGKRISILGYGSQGRAQALCFRDSGLDVIIGVREGKSFEKAKADGMEVMSVVDAVKDADIIMMLLPDEAQADIYAREIAPNMKKGCVLEFAHGFAITYDLIHPPNDSDVIMMAPKGPGPMIRRVYESGYGVPALICIHQDVSSKAKDLALALAKAMNCTKPGVFEATFPQETMTDLFGEQAVLCGGYTAMIKMAFETLVKRGFPPEMAYFEVLHETKLVTDLVVEKGIEGMWKNVSNTAEYGGLTRRDRVITEESRKGMESILDDIQSGKFAKEWVEEYHNNLKNMKAMQDADGQEEIEKVGGWVRETFFGRRE
ncbi:MAG: ketol-acid reductoisomerase [Candidatus Methanomethylophilaceae archaeon]|nr:ketol-acid reductoisomerase [Candidatus Methanomethylophilaceae archaeon]